MGSSDDRPPRPVDSRGERAVELPHFDFLADFATVSVQGRARSRNQDVILCDPEISLFGVADGLGGHAAGEVAARIAVDTAAEHLGSGQMGETVGRFAADPNIENRRVVLTLLEEAVHEAHRAVIAEGTDDPAKQDMGTTLDLVLLVRDRAFVAHVGDSRVYLLRPTVTLQLTDDHKRYDGMRSSSGRTPPSSLAGPLSNSIGQRSQLRVDTVFAALETGDRLIVGSDGAFSDIENENTLAKPTDTPGADNCCSLLLDNAQNAGGLDDISLVVIDVGSAVEHAGGKASHAAEDAAVAGMSPLLCELNAAQQKALLASAIELDLPNERTLARRITGDRVAYIILEGSVKLHSGRTLGPSGMLHAESLVDLTRREALPVTAEPTRLLRIRLDDFEEVCALDRDLAARLYERLARHLARLAP